MKSWMLIAIVAVGGYATYSYYQKKKTTASGSGSTDASTDSWLNSLIGIGPTSGVPVFNMTAAPNKPDQVLSPLATNPDATMGSSGVYQPAFGFDENREGGLLTF